MTKCWLLPAFTGLLLCFSVNLFARQQYGWQQVYATTIHLSAAAENAGKANTDRSLIEIELPAFYAGYVFRLTVNNDTSSEQIVIPLINALKSSVTSALETAVRANTFSIVGDGSLCDIFLFKDSAIARTYVNHPYNLFACNSYRQIGNKCVFEGDCADDNIQVLVRNMHKEKSIRVQFEIVALIDTQLANGYEETIGKPARKAIYENCMETSKDDTVLKEKRSDFCKCIADKIDFKEILLSVSDEDALLRLVRTGGLDCLRQLGVYSVADELREDKLVMEAGTIEKTKGKAAAVDFCAKKIDTGAESEFLYVQLGWYALQIKQFDRALYYLEKGVGRYPTNLYIQCNYAHALLLTGQFQKALYLYRKYRDQNIDKDLSWRRAIVDDVKTLKQIGISNEHFDEVQKIMEKK